MAETMLLTKALDERDFLCKKIVSRIKEANYVDHKINASAKCAISSKTPEEFAADVTAEVQGIRDQIKRYYALCDAIVQTNAITEVEVRGVKRTIAQWISIRNMYKTSNPLEHVLADAVANQYNNIIRSIEVMNRRVDDQYAAIENDLIKKQRTETDSSVSDDLELVAKTKENKKDAIVDPLDCAALVKELNDSVNDLVKEINAAIKIANATTSITIE